MGYLYMRSQTNSMFWTKARIPGKTKTASLQEIVLTSTREDSLFRVMRRVYRLLDDWRASHADVPVLLTVDPRTAKVVNSYFFNDMTENEFDRFFLSDGEVRRYML